VKNPPPLLAIHDGDPRDTAFAAWLQAVADDGVPAVQIRAKALDDRALFEVAREARRLAPPELALWINGRIDVALAADCDGVHLPADSPPVAALRRRFGDRIGIGLSTHHPEEVAQAARDGADYVTFGPIYPTPSKAAYGPPPGLEGLERAVAAAPGFPILALGGVFPQHLPAVARAGAYGAAGIRTFQDPASRQAMVRGAEVFPAPLKGNR
jgi:thiamine-phosphate pyrophosphorylase